LSLSRFYEELREFTTASSKLGQPRRHVDSLSRFLLFRMFRSFASLRLVMSNKYFREQISPVVYPCGLVREDSPALVSGNRPVRLGDLEGSPWRGEKLGLTW
jgi:hypothetical protein